MNVSLSTPPAIRAAETAVAGPNPPARVDGEEAEVRAAFASFVGQTLFGQVLKAMRQTVRKPAYFHGGRAEEIFTQQLDQVLAEKLSDASGERLAGGMFELFSLRRR